jgi:hypothetical protein
VNSELVCPKILTKLKVRSPMFCGERDAELQALHSKLFMVGPGNGTPGNLRLWWNARPFAFFPENRPFVMNVLNVLDSSWLWSSFRQRFGLVLDLLQQF